MRLTDSNYASFKVKRTKMVFITGGDRGDLDPVSRTNFREIHAERISKGKLQIPLLFYKVQGNLRVLSHERNNSRVTYISRGELRLHKFTNHACLSVNSRVTH